MLHDLILAETSSNGGKQLKLQIKKSSKLQIKRLRDKGNLIFLVICFLELLFFRVVYMTELGMKASKIKIYLCFHVLT